MLDQVEGDCVNIVIFDLDGTLVDSVADIRAATNRMLVDEGAGELDLQTITSFVGDGLPKLVERALIETGIGLEQQARLTETVLQYYSRASCVLTSPYANVETVLAGLKSRGFRLGVCTNKPVSPARDVLQSLGLAQYFDAVIGGDSLAVKKPDPAPLWETAAALGGETLLYVGDSEVDAATAVNAGVPFALFSEGYRKSPVADIPHAYAFSDFTQLDGIVDAARQSVA